MHAKTFPHNLMQLAANCFEEYKRLCCAECNFANPAFSAEVILMANKRILDAICEGFANTVPPDHLKYMVLACLRFAYPTVGPDDDVNNDDLWLFSGTRLLSRV